MVAKKPPRKPPRSPGTFGREAVVCKPSLPDEDDEGLGSKEENVYEDVTATTAATDLHQSSNRAPVATEKALLSGQKCRPNPPLPRRPRPQGGNRLGSSDTHVESMVVDTVATEGPDEVEVEQGSRPRSVTVVETEETVYNEPIIHRSNTVSGATQAPKKWPPKRREIPLPPSTGQSSPRRQRPLLPVRPRPNVGQLAARSPVMQRMRQQRSHGALDVKEEQQPTIEDDAFSVPLRPRSISSQNVMKCDGDGDDNDNEEPMKRCQSLDMVDVIPGSSGRNNTADIAAESDTSVVV